jgi:murein DD-endopeptidase MepM/ murein hydrolase activator NlpD
MNTCLQRPAPDPTRPAGTRNAARAAGALAAGLLLVSCTGAPPDTSAVEDAGATVAAGGVAAGGTASPAPAGTDPDALTPVTAFPLAAPVPVTGTDGRVHLAYELIVTNTYQEPATIMSVTVLDGERTLQRVRGTGLAAKFRVVGGTEAVTLAPGQQGLLWLDPTVASLDEVPDRLQHVLDVRFAQATPPLVPRELAEGVADVPVQSTQAVAIRSPLSGPRWLDGNGCCDVVTPHRAALNPFRGALWAPERFAIDFVRLDRRGRLFDGPRNRLSSYHYYGAPVRAVAGGPVVAVVDDLEEQTPGANPTGLPIDQFGGNHVVQDIGDGRYALYAHLQPGPTEGVSVGSDLRAGQLVGRLGNTGNTDSPHLHFHVMDSPDPLASNGLPYVIDTFDVEGRLASAANAEALVDGARAQFATNQQTGPRTGELPLFLDVLRFPDGS